MLCVFSSHGVGISSMLQHWTAQISTFPQNGNSCIFWVARVYIPNCHNVFDGNVAAATSSHTSQRISPRRDICKPKWAR